MYEYFRRILPRERASRSSELLSLGQGEPGRPARAVLHGRSGVQDARPIATRSAACTARFRRRCGQDLWPKLPVWESPDHFRHQRRAPADVAQRRSGAALRPVSAAGLARALQRPEDLGRRCRTSPTRELWDAHRRRKRNLLSVRARARWPPARSHAKLRRPSSGAWPTCSIPMRSPSASRAASPPTSAPLCCSATSTG